jgi:hypothetical protein
MEADVTPQPPRPCIWHLPGHPFFVTRGGSLRELYLIELMQILASSRRLIRSEFTSSRKLAAAPAIARLRPRLGPTARDDAAAIDRWGCPGAHWQAFPQRRRSEIKAK